MKGTRHTKTQSFERIVIVQFHNFTICSALCLAPPMIRQVSPRDLMTFLAVAAVLLLVSTFSMLVPAIGAARVDPIVALRID
jgi:hypothetical protein